MIETSSRNEGLAQIRVCHRKKIPLWALLILIVTSICFLLAIAFPIEKKSNSKSSNKHSEPRIIHTPIAPSKAPSTSNFFDESVFWTLPMETTSPLVNLGNTCFMNAAVQALFAIPPIYNYLLKVESDKKFTKSFSEIAKAMKTGKPYRPTVMKTEILPELKLNKANCQEDASEFLLLAQDRIERENNGKKRFRIQNGLFQSFDIFEYVFHMKFGIIIRFNDGRIGIDDAVFNGIYPLAWDGPNTPQTLVDLLNINFSEFSPQDLKQQHRRNYIASAPRIFALQIDCFNPITGVKKGNIKIPEKLNIQAYMLPNKQDVPTDYDLISVIYHQGVTRHMGHYFAQVKHHGIWFEKNDGMSKKIATRNSKDAPYIVFYQKRGILN